MALRLSAAALTIALFLASPTLALAEIYRVIDADGKISFTDQPPLGQSDARSETVEVDDTTQNTSLSRDAIKEDQPEWLRQAQQKRSEEAAKARANAPTKDEMAAWKQSLKSAKRELRESKVALENGVVASEGDFIGRAGGGVRPSDQYFNKLRALEENVVSAEKNIVAVKKAKPR